MRKYFVLALIAGLAIAAFAQSAEPTAILEYFDDADGVFVFASNGDELFPEYGMELAPGDKVKTTSSTAEIRLDPNRSLIKLANNTEFVVDTLQNKGGAEANTFSLVSGKIRGVFARDGVAQYQIATQAAVCGVRGTRLGIDYVPGSTAKLLLQSGAASFTNLLTGAVIDLEPGQLADALADTFQAITATSEQISEFFEGIDTFQGEGLDENAVPGNEPEVTDAATDDSDEPPSGTAPVIDEPTEEVVATVVTPDEAAEAGLFEPIMDWLREALGMEIGTITIDDKTYSKAVLQPQFAIGRLKMGLYIPVIYETNMFDPEDWYRPRGNDEWSFGTDVADGGGWGADPVAAAWDAASDLFLKIRYLEWGEQRDKFFFKVGNLDNMTVGHGLLMRNYANDADFPSVRRVGVNLGFDLGVIGIETVVNDLAEPEIMGGRFYLRPFGRKFGLAVGASAIIDIDPSGELPRADDATEISGPIFLNAALDIDLPIIEKDFLSIILFGDVGGMMPYFRKAVPGLADSRDEMLYTAALIVADPEGQFPLRNYGIAAGVFGNIFILDYRIEYRNFNGTFRPAFYGPNYDRERYGYVDQLTAELIDPANTIVPIVGIYGEAGFSIGKKFYLEAGYMWPWIPGDPSDYADITAIIGSPSENDELHIKAVVERGLIPVIDIHGSFSYDRTGFIPTLLAKGLPEGITVMQALFDANTVMSGELIYPVAEMLDVALLVTTNIARDDKGNVILAPNGLPEITPSISIETRIHF